MQQVQRLATFDAAHFRAPQFEIVISATASLIAPAAIRELEALHLGNATVTGLDHAIRIEGLSAADAAKRWQAEQSDEASSDHNSRSQA